MAPIFAIKILILIKQVRDWKEGMAWNQGLIGLTKQVERGRALQFPIPPFSVLLA